jgi:hypothetical protein
LVAKWVNGRSRPSYCSDAHGQGDYLLLVRVYIVVVVGKIVVGPHYI